MGPLRIALALIVWLAATPLPLLAGEQTRTVEISHGQLNPPEVSIKKGEAVTFVNTVTMSGGHSVAADDGSFESPALDKNQSWAHTFEAAGTFPYHIKEHPDAKGVIRVE